MTDMDELMNAEFKEAFDEFDKVLELVMEVDLNGDGTIDFQEFLQMMKKKSSEADQMEDLRDAFRMFDRNKDGYIDLIELRKVTSLMGATLSSSEIQEFMKEADKDGNGKIDYDEFVNMMKQY